MGFGTFFVAFLVSLGSGVYLFNFSMWLWRRQNRLGATGGFLLLLLSVGGALVYFTMKL
ncbi:MAG: hypothetical protein ACYCYO_10925 [Bacilli bacterium]